MRFTFVLILISVFFACSNDSEKTSPLMIETTDTIQVPAKQTEPKVEEKKEKGKFIDGEDLIGFWFQPRFAEDNIKFLRDKSFVFHRYNSVLGIKEKLVGTYMIESNAISLYYSDRSKEIFNAYFEERDESWRIKNKDNNFIKGVDGYEVIQNKEE